MRCSIPLLVTALTALTALRVGACQARPAEPIPDVYIEVELRGNAAPPVDGARLRSIAPDFRDGAQRAWILRNLFPGVLMPGVSLEASDGSGGRVVDDRPGSDLEGRTLALIVDGSGGAFVARIARDAPFDDVDPNSAPHVRRLRIFRPADEQREPPAPDPRAGLRLTAIVDHAPPVTWTFDALDAVKRARGAPEGRDIWSLRDLVGQLVGPNSRVTALENGAGKSATIDRDAWSDDSSVPMIKLNRRGELKVWWTDAAAPGRGPTLLDAVTTIRVAR